jgi:hypothetical protein
LSGGTIEVRGMAEVISLDIDMSEMAVMTRNGIRRVRSDVKSGGNSAGRAEYKGG